MGKIIDFESLARAAMDTQDFNEAYRELREYIKRLPLAQTQRAELTELTLRQMEVLAKLILSQLKQAVDKNGGNIDYTIQINPRHETEDT